MILHKGACTSKPVLCRTSTILALHSHYRFFRDHLCFASLPVVVVLLFDCRHCRSRSITKRRRPREKSRVFSARTIIRASVRRTDDGTMALVARSTTQAASSQLDGDRYSTEQLVLYCTYRQSKDAQPASRHPFVVPSRDKANNKDAKRKKKTRRRQRQQQCTRRGFSRWRGEKAKRLRLN